MSTIVGSPERPWGVLGVHTTRRRDFNDEDAQFLQAIANIIALAIQREETEDGLRETNDLQYAVFQSAPVAIITLDASARVRQWNPASERIFGWKRDEVLGGPLPYLREDVRQEHDALFAKTMSGQTLRGVHVTRCRKDGSAIQILLSAAPLFDAQGNVQGGVGIFMDVTANKQAEERFRNLLESSPDAMVIVSRLGEIVLANANTEQLFGYTPEELVGQQIEILIPERFRDKHGGHRAGFFSKPKLRPMGPGLELFGLRQDGTEFPVEISLSPMEAEQDVLVCAAIRDITERKALEAEFRQAQKLEAVGRLAGGIAHDFNNLLGVIMLRTDRRLAHLPADDSQRSSAGEIRRAADRGASLTYQLLAFSRKQVLEPKVLDLNEVIADVSKLLEPIIGEDVELKIIPASDIGYVKADPAQVAQILMNLAVNARDAMPTGGTIVIETQNAELDEAYARQHVGVQAGRYVALAVSDTGIGMDKATQARIFEPFFTTKGKERGTGLGLSTVYGIVKQSAGHIWVYSELGHGSTFKIFLPRVEQEPLTPKIHTRTVAPNTVSETILLVEDDPSLRRGAREVMEDTGYRVLEAGSATQAMRIAEEHGSPIHLLLTDLVLPKRSGRFLAESLRSSRPDTKVLYVSGYTDEVTFHRGALNRGEAFLQKPFSSAELTRKVREVLEDKD